MQRAHCLFIFQNVATAQDFEWISQFGTPDSDVAGGAAADSSGVYVAGSTIGVFPGQSAAGGIDVPLVLGSRSTYIRGRLGGVEGRALGSQSTVPFGTPDEIRAEVAKLCREMGKGGGYILSPAKGLQPETPTENAAAVVEAFLGQAGVTISR